MGTLEGRVAIVTGGGKGLGRAFALELARRGAAVVVNNRNREVDADGRGPADHVVAEIQAGGGRAVADHGDVVDPATGAALVEKSLTEFGRVDICVTSAGVSLPQMFHKTTPKNIKTVLDINVLGTVYPAAAAMAAMREAGFGRIVLVASGAGLHGEPTVSAYAASKGAVVALGRTLAVEGAAKGVLTNVLLPYATTQMTETGMDPRHADSMSPDVVAPVLAALCEPDSSLNGQVIVAGGSGVRATDAVESDTVLLSTGNSLTSAELTEMLERSRAGARRTYPHAQGAFQSLAVDIIRLRAGIDIDEREH